MRSSAPIPGNPWPHDMGIEVDDEPHGLISLLWVREAWSLTPTGEELPPLLVDTPDAAVSREAPDATRPNDTTGWADAWPQVWNAAVAHAGEIRDPHLFEELSASPLGSAERAVLLARLVGPSAHDRFMGAFDASWDRWNRARFESRSHPRFRTLDEHPERRSLEALIPAWQRGLTKIVTIPVRGEHTRRIGAHVLLTTDATRADPARYAEALASFARA